MTMSKIKVTTATKKTFVTFCSSLSANADRIREMLNEDDYPVEFWHDASGMGHTFWSDTELDEYIADLKTAIKQAA